MPHAREFVSRYHAILATPIECLCRSDRTNCGTEAGRNHSISKSASISSISESNHVYRLTNEPRVERDGVTISEHADFELESHKEASTFRGLCSFHDNKLFMELDRHDTSDIEKFLIQGFYRAVCFELFRKNAAVEATPLMRELDKGKSLSQQIEWQKRCDTDEISHRGGCEFLEKLREEFESAVLSKTSLELAYFVAEYDSSLPMTAFGCFQPSLDWDGLPIQRVNEFMFVNGQIIKERLQSVFAFCLPTNGTTILGFCALKKDSLALKFMNSIQSSTLNLAESVSAKLALQVENIYFRPSFIDGMPAEKKSQIGSLFVSASGVDVTPVDIQSARTLQLFRGAYVPTAICSNF